MADVKTYTLWLTGHQHAVMLGLAVSAADEARRDGRTGPWVDTVHELIKAVDVPADMDTSRNRRN